MALSAGSRRGFAAGMASLWLTACAAGCQAPGPRVLDLEGREAEPLRLRDARAAVILFLRRDCPISNRYAPEIHRLYDRFAGRGVAFWMVYPDADARVEDIRGHVREFGYPGGILRDPKHELVRMTGASVTPEAAVFVRRESGAEMVYRGRIDDRYADFGTMRPQATTHDLEDVLDAILAGGPLAPRTNAAVGCFIEERGRP